MGIPVRTGPFHRVDETLGANAREDSEGYLTPTVFTKPFSNPLGDYAISDKDDDASPNYYGFVDKDGNWYIMEETVVAGADTYRYIKGATGYIAAWTGRGLLVYDYFYNIF